MSWFHDEETGHEGTVVGLVEVRHGWRELGVADQTAQPVLVVQAACECGWRSPRMRAPSGTRFVPSAVMLPPGYDDRARVLWREHIQQIVDRRRAGDADPESWLVTARP